MLKERHSVQGLNEMHSGTASSCWWHRRRKTKLGDRKELLSLIVQSSARKENVILLEKIYANTERMAGIALCPQLSALW